MLGCSRVAPPEEHDELALTAVTPVGNHDFGDELRPGHLHLVVIGDGNFATHPLPAGATVSIGRSNQCDIAVDDKSISRRHAILNIGKTVTIEDLGSANGTRVRGNQLKPGHPIAIAVGELIGLGTVSVIVQHQSRPARTRKMWTHDYFEARLEEECAREERSGVMFALMRIHADRRAPTSFVEETLFEFVRESDILGKHGPHEYELLLLDTPPDKADDVVRRFEGKLLERGLKCRMFVACCPRDGRSPHLLTARVQAPASKDRPVTTGPEIVVSDAQMQSLHRLVEQVAGSKIGVLLLGETGVGKEVFARAVHRASQRAAGPFVELNCAALTETLLESELFGHEKGAFTHASSAKPGLIETADGGTLLLDEIGDMPLSTQVKLLRVIEDSQLRRVGGLKSRAIDVRFVAATNSNLEARIAEGTFRSDLFFRLNGVTILIPPLRDRLPELEPLALTFIAKSWPSDAGRSPTLSPEALELMRSYRWPGNVRELKHMIERAVLLCGKGPIQPEHLPAEKMRADRRPEPQLPTPSAASAVGTIPPATEPSASTVMLSRRKGSEDEEQWIMQALERAGGNQTLAARLLGISRRTLVNRLNDYKSVHRPRKDKK